jgi:hypothetical protein
LGKSENKGLMSKAETLLFHSYDLQRESSFTGTRFLFNSIKHLRLQSEENCRVYEAREKSTRAIKARIAFHIRENEAVSPLSAPFGFVEIYRKISADQLIDFFLLIETDLRYLGIRKIRIKSYPEVYDKNFRVAEDALKKLNYTVIEEVSSIVPVDSKPFEKKIRTSERQKIKKAVKLFSFEKVKSVHSKEIYSFIEECRNEKNQTLSMSFSDLAKTVSLFPKNFFFYRVYDVSGTAAAAIVIKINKEILYTFYYAHVKRFDKVSPIVFLIARLYEIARADRFVMIDLGTSMFDGKVNRPLLHFKRSIGGESTRKLIFEKQLT